MKLPEAPAELLQDTVPPNGSVKAPPVASPELGATTDAPVVDHSRSNDTLIIPRVQRKQRARAVVIGTMAAAMALAVVGAIIASGKPTVDTDGSPEPQPIVVHDDNPPTQPATTKPLAAAKPAPTVITPPVATGSSKAESDASGTKRPPSRAVEHRGTIDKQRDIIAPGPTKAPAPVKNGGSSGAFDAKKLWDEE